MKKRFLTSWVGGKGSETTTDSFPSAHDLTQNSLDAQLVAALYHRKVVDPLLDPAGPTGHKCYCMNCMFARAILHVRSQPQK